MQQNNFKISISNFTQIENSYPVLLNCSADFFLGNIYYLSGPNGAGKSSLLKIINKEIINNFPDKTIATLPDENIFEESTTIEILQTIFSKEEFDYYIDRIFLKKIDKKKKIKDFSAGQKRILNLITLFCYNPDVLILDEPFDHIDSKNIDKIVEILLELNKNGTTIFFASHLITDKLNNNSIQNEMSGGTVISSQESIPNTTITSNKKNKLSIFKFEFMNYFRNGILIKFLIPLSFSILMLGSFTLDPDSTTFSIATPTIVWLSIITSLLSFLPYSTLRVKLYKTLNIRSEKIFFIICISNCFIALSITLFNFIISLFLFNQKIENILIIFSSLALGGLGLGITISIVAFLTREAISSGVLLLLPTLIPLSLATIRSWENGLTDYPHAKSWLLFLISWLLLLCSLCIVFCKELVENE